MIAQGKSSILSLCIYNMIIVSKSKCPIRIFELYEYDLIGKVKACPFRP